MMKPNTQPSSVKHKAWWDWFAAILLVLAVLTATVRLVETNWSPELSLVQIVALAGVVIGLALGQTRFSGRLSFGVAWAYGLFIIFWQASLTAPNHLAWKEGLLHVSERINAVIRQVSAGELITDSIIFILLMAILFWILSAAAGFSLSRRGSAWWAILPIGIVTFVIHFYHNCPYSQGANICNSPGLLTGASYIGTYLLFSLLLIGRATYFHNLADWTRRRIFVAPEVGFDLTRFIIAVALACILLAWFAPVAYARSIPLANQVWTAAGEPVRRLNDILSPLFESVRTAVTVETDDFGTQLSLGRGGELSDRVAMQVEVKGPFVANLPYYWRNRVYDTYENGGWQTTITETERLNGETLPISSTIVGADVQFTFTSQRGLSVLYTPTRSIRFSPIVDVERSLYPDGTVDVTAVRAAQVLRPGQSYQVVGKTFPVTIAQLKEAGSDYPAWIQQRYLQLPPEITERTLQLAQQIAEGQETPYDKVAAVTNYLRENLEYAEIIPAPPPNQEPLDWVLFDYGAAFCNYYASAEIVLLRSLGIPARLVVGYAQGQRQTRAEDPGLPPEAGVDPLLSAPGIYLIRARDAHAWPEVYFPGIGWVEFEPTASIRAIARPSGENVTDLVPPVLPELNRDFPAMDDPTPEPNREWDNLRDRVEQQPAWVQWLPTLGAASLLAALLFWHGALLVKLETFLRQQGIKTPDWLRRWADAIRKQKPWITRFETWLRKIGLRPPAFIQRWSAWAMLSPIQRAYAEVNRALTRLGHEPAVKDTPTERLTFLAELLPEAAESCRRLLTEYQAEIYSQHTTHPAIARLAADRIRTHSLRAWLRRLLRLHRAVPTEQPTRP
jgi:transglutaminase-like putative cysteine protease